MTIEYPLNESTLIRNLNPDYRKILWRIREYTGERPKLILAPRDFTYITGSVESSIFLSQMLYWQDKTSNQERWIYKTYQEWCDETGLKMSQVKKAVHKLVALGILDTKLKKARSVPTLHYRLLIENLEQIIDAYYASL